MLLYSLIRRGVISHGRADEILGIHKWDLIEFYDSVGLPYLDQSKEELPTEVLVRGPTQVRAMIVVSDSTPLITLMKAAQLDILHELFDEVVISDAVFRELTTNPHFPEEDDQIPQ